MQGYFYLIMTIIFETLSIILMKMADGATNKRFLILGAICYVATFFLLTMALKYLPMGYTNAVWAGFSTLLVYILGTYYFGEKTNIQEIFFLLLIIVGLVGLNFLQKGK